MFVPFQFGFVSDGPLLVSKWDCEERNEDLLVNILSFLLHLCCRFHFAMFHLRVCFSPSIPSVYLSPVHFFFKFNFGDFLFSFRFLPLNRRFFEILPTSSFFPHFRTQCTISLAFVRTIKWIKITNRIKEEQKKY